MIHLRRDRSRGLRLTTLEETQESTAAGIYGVIIGGAVMAASHAPTARALAVSVLVTLTVYWAAERYSRLVAERIHEGRQPGVRAVVRQLTTGWEMVTASLVPLGVLVLLRAIGAEQEVAVTGALLCSTTLLFLAGWEMGRAGALSRRERLVSATVAGAFGIFLIVLKKALH